MEARNTELGNAIISIKRIEYLLEEIVFQQIVSRSETLEDADQNFQKALEHVSNELKEYFNSQNS